MYLIKTHQHSGKITETIYLQVSEQAEIAKEEGLPISVSGMLRKLGVTSSTSFFRLFSHLPPGQSPISWQIQTYHRSWSLGLSSSRQPL